MFVELLQRIQTARKPSKTKIVRIGWMATPLGQELVSLTGLSSLVERVPIHICAVCLDGRKCLDHGFHGARDRN